MNQTHPADDHSVPGKRRSMIADRLDHATAWVYRSIVRGPLGRIFTAYRRAETNWQHDKRRVGRGACRPVSFFRHHVREVAESGYILRGIRAASHYLFTCPLSFYGWLGVFYALCGVGIYFIPSLIGMGGSFSSDRLWIFLGLLLFSLPMVFSSKPLSRALGSGICARWLFVDLLGLPKDGLLRTEKQNNKALPYLAFPLGMILAVPSWWLHPLMVPGICIGVGLLGMILTYPEVGVVLASLSLPTLWLGRFWLLLPLSIILITWMSFLIKWLFMHRTVRWGLLDTVVLIFCLQMPLSGMIGQTVTPQSVSGSVLWFILFSLFFLISQLITTRAQIRRCLLGVGVAVAMTVMIGLLQMIPIGGLDWLAGSPAGTAIVQTLHGAHETLMPLWQEMTMTVILLFLPFMCVRTATVVRPLRYLLMALMWGATLVTVAVLGTPALWVCMAFSLLLYAFLYSHHTLTVAIVAALPATCGVWWMTVWAPNSMQTAAHVFFGGVNTYRETLWGQVWRMIVDHPVGIGWGKEAFVATYAAYADDPLTAAATGSDNLYFELLTAMGWPGLILFVAVVFVFLQKVLTSVHDTGNRRDRVMLLGGLSSVAGMLLLGTVRGFFYDPFVILGFWLIFSLTSAYAGIAEETCDELTADKWYATGYEDRIFRIGS